MKEKKMLWIIVGVVVAVIAVGVFLVMEMFSGPLYRPGSAKPPSAAAKIEGDYFVLSNGAKLYFQSQGQREPILMLHGGPGYPFQKPWPALANLAGYQFIYYDQRGCGKSDRPFDRLPGTNTFEHIKTVESALGIAAQLADIEAIRRGLGVDKISLIGHSFGGFLAALYAAEYPDHVKKLVLVAPAAVMLMPSGDGDLYGEIGRNLRDPSDQAQYAAWLKTSFDFPLLLTKSETELSQLNSAFLPFWAKATGDKSADTTSVQSTDHAIGGFVIPALFLSLGKKHDFRPALARITAPTLILTASQDIAAKESVIKEQYLSAMPTARLKIIPASGHFLFDAQATEFANSLAEFLKQVQ